MKLRNTLARSSQQPGGWSATAPGFVVAALALGLALAGCTDKPEEEGGAKEEELPDVKVELPPSPNFDDARAPVKWEDDAYSIFGLRKDIDERIKEGEAGEEIIVKGYVQEIYVPPVCPEDQLCPPGKQPHFWITDKPDEKGKKRAMMVVNYYFPIPEWDEETQKMWEEQPLVNIEVGKQYTIKGLFKRFSDTGFAHDNGLLEFRYYKAPNPENPAEMLWIAPPNSNWHPQTVAAQEEQNRIMQEKAAKDAAAMQKKKEAAAGG